MRSSALTWSLGAGVLFACAMAGLQGGCVNRQTPARLDTPDAGSTHDAMLPPDASNADGAGTPSDTDAASAGANDDTASDEESAGQMGEGGDAAPEAGEDADTDAAGDADSAIDCGSLSPTDCVLESQRGPACRMCAQSQCADPSMQCEHFAGQAAASGPAMGQSRQDLCLTTLSCILTTKCYLYGTGVDACYCGSEGRFACLDGGPAPNVGRFCLPEEQNGLETSEASVALGSILDTSLGAGTANALQQCLEIKCATSKCL